MAPEVDEGGPLLIGSTTFVFRILLIRGQGRVDVLRHQMTTTQRRVVDRSDTAYSRTHYVEVNL